MTKERTGQIIVEERTEEEGGTRRWWFSNKRNGYSLIYKNANSLLGPIYPPGTATNYDVTGQEVDTPTITGGAVFTSFILQQPAGFLIA